MENKIMKELESLYRESNNPIFIWQAICDSSNIPDWCYEYIKSAALEIMLLADAKDMTASEKTAKVPTAMGLSSPGRNAFREIAAIHKDAQIAFWYETNMRQGEKAESLYRRAADELECDVSTVKRAIRRARERWDAQRDENRGKE